MPINEEQGVVVAAPKTDQERMGLASACVRNLKIDLPAVVDGIDNNSGRAYAAWPDRLVVIDKYGRVAYKSKPGPFGFRPGEMAAVLAGEALQR